MRLLIVAALSLHIFWISFGNGEEAQGHTVTFHIHNKCPFPIWPATAPNNGFPVLANGGFLLPSGKTRRIMAPWKWAGRVWARTGCANFNNGTGPACQTGDCGGRLQCNGLAGIPPATLLQVSVQSDQTALTFYDISLVDGYNLPVSVSPRPDPAAASDKCVIRGCGKNLNELCPEELRVLSDGGEVVACKSACLAFELDAFCCRNEYGTSEKCGASVYSRMFKEACPWYYSYAFDSPPPLASCGAKEYVVTFCPSAWGGGAGDGVGNFTVGVGVAR